MPCRAEIAVEIAITSGIASPNEGGEEMMRTVTARVTASSGGRGVRDAGGEEAGGDGKVEEEPREAIGEGLGRGSGRLGAASMKTLDAGQRRLGADRLDPHPDRRAGDDGPRHHAVAHALVHRVRSPVIIDSSSSAAPSTIAPSAEPARRAHQTDVARRGAAIGTASICCSE